MNAIATKIEKSFQIKRIYERLNWIKNLKLETNQSKRRMWSTMIDQLDYGVSICRDVSRSKLRTDHVDM